MSYEKTLNFSTDVAALAIFDPFTLDRRINDEIDWWAVPFEEIDEVKSGSVALVSIGGDGTYSLRITDGSLTDIEKRNAVDLIENVGVTVTSGKLYVGDAIKLPGGGSNPSSELSFDFENGQYRLSLYALNQPDDAVVPDIVVLMELASTRDELSLSQMKLDWTSENYLYSSKPKPKLGKKLTGKVWKSHRTDSGLIVKDSDYCWPDSHDDYDVILTDMSEVSRGDIVSFRTVDIDFERELIIGELLNIK